MSAAAAAATGPEGARGKGKRKLLLIAAPLLLVALATGGYFGGFLDPLLGRKPSTAAGADQEAARHRPPAFVDLPELITNLDTGGRRTSYVKLRAKIEIAREEDAQAIQAAMPRIVDLLQTYLREMHPDELRGSVGTYRLREELLARIDAAVAPVQAEDVLFVELIVQ